MATLNKNGQLHSKAANGDLLNLYPNTKIENVEGLQSALDGKVSVVSGKGLSTNDYTTTEKNKLAGIAAGATANIGTVTQVKVGSTAYNPSSGVVSLPAYPTSLPASDVYSWAKASSKPSYSASEVGAIATSAKGAVSGVASLDSNGKVPASQLPTASTSAAGITKLYDGFDSESTTMGATAHTIRILKDTIYSGFHIKAHSAAEGMGASISYTMNRSDFDPITGESSSGNRATGVYLLVCTNWSTAPAPYIAFVCFSAADTSTAQLIPIVSTSFIPSVSITGGIISVSSASKISLYSVF